MKKISAFVFAAPAASMLGAQQFRFATSNASSKNTSEAKIDDYQATQRELGDYTVGGNTYYFGDSGEVAPVALKHDPSKKMLHAKAKAQIDSKGSVSGKKNPKAKSVAGDAANFGANKCIDGGVRISLKQQEKFERQQKKLEKDLKKKEAAKKKKAADKKKKRAQAKSEQKKAAVVKPEPVKETGASAASGQAEGEEISGNLAPSIPPFGFNRDSISSSAAVKAGEALSSSRSKFSAVTTLISDRIISFRAKAARAICPTPEQMIAVQTHEVERRQIAAAKAFLALQEGEQLQKQFRSEVDHSSEVYPNSTTSITGFGLIGRSAAEPPQEYEISTADAANSAQNPKKS